MSSTFQPSNSLSFQLPENISFSKDPEQFHNQFTNMYYRMAKASNNKDIGSYETTELINGQQFFGATPQTKRSIYRKVIEFGALPNAALKSVAHNISGLTANSMVTRIYGMAREPTGIIFIPIPNSGPTYPLQLYVDATNISISTTVNLSTFTYCIVVMEYYKI